MPEPLVRSTRLLLVAFVVAVAATARGADHTTVDALLTVSSELPEVSRRALLAEAESIWREAGIAIRWTDGQNTVRSRPLRVLVVRRPAAPGHGGNWVVGELLRFDDGGAIALASIARAEEIVQAARGGRAPVAPESVVQHRLGVVLGRAVAHEIGHYLLESGAHASQGLMRATFQPREFTDLRSGTFDLDEESQRRIHQRLRATSPPDRVARLAFPNF